MTVSKSSILSYAWVIARHDANQSGEPVRSKIGAAMRRAWAEAKAAAAAAVASVQQAVAQQFADFDPVDFDPEGGRPDLVCASADEACIILTGMDAEAAGQDPRAAEIAAAAATVHPPGVPDNRWLDEEVAAFVDSVLREAGDVDVGEPFLPRLSDEFIAEWSAYHATRRWADLFERESEAPSSVPYGDLFDARQAMQAAHAHLDAITVRGAV